MTVKSVRKDEQALTMTVTAEFDAAVEEVWELWADPRKLERWWGPPTYPATVVEHALVADGRVTYFLTGPEGDRHHGWWRIGSVHAPRAFDFQDGFADETGAPNPDLPTTHARVTLEVDAGRQTVMVITTTFASLDAMQELVKMGMEEGITLALGQADALLMT